MPAHRTIKQTELAINLMIASLSVFFAAAIAAVLLVSQRLPQAASLPAALWLATACVVGTSITLQLAGIAVRRERQQALRTWMGATLALSLVFFITQSVGMWQLATHHLAAQTASRAWIMMFFLVGLHALHVLAGLGILGMAGYRAFQGRLDHEYHPTLTVATRYWHFLDAVWLALLLTGVMLLH